MKAGSWTVQVCALALVWAALEEPRSLAQPGPDADESPSLHERPRVDYDSEPPYSLYERYWNRRFPAPYRRQFRREYYPFGRPYYPRRYRDRYPRGYGWWQGGPYGFGGFGTAIFDDGYVGGEFDHDGDHDWGHDGGHEWGHDGDFSDHHSSDPSFSAATDNARRDFGRAKSSAIKAWSDFWN